MTDERRPLRDVYAGDLKPADGAGVRMRAVFEVRVDCDPGSLPRVMATLALANTAPLRVNCEREGTDELLMTAVVDGVTATAADLILRKLQQLSVVVEASLMCEEMPRPVGLPTRA